MKNQSRCRWFGWIGVFALLAMPVGAEVIQVDLDLIVASAETNQWPVTMTENAIEGGAFETQTAFSTGTLSVDLDVTIDPGTQVATLNTVTFLADEPGNIEWNDLGYFIGFSTVIDVLGGRGSVSSPGGAITPAGGTFPSEDVPFTLNGGLLDVFDGPDRDFSTAPVTAAVAGQTGTISVGAPVTSGVDIIYPVSVTVPVAFAVDSVVSNGTYDIDMAVGDNGPPVTVLAATGQIVRTTLEITNAGGATDVTQTQATLNGELVETFGEATTVTVYWGTTDGGTTPGAWDASVDLGVSAEGPVSTTVMGLALDTTYYYRYHAGNANGEAWAATTAGLTTDPDFAQFAHMLPITFDGYTRPETLDNFPVLIQLSEQTVPCFDYGLFTHSSNGADLRFSDATGQALNYEIDHWDPAGVSAIWVQVPALDSGTIITAYWGNASAGATPPAYTTDGSAWSDDYVGVWHFNEDSGTVSDSSGNGLHGNPMGDVTQGTNGLVGGAVFMNDDNTGDGAHIDLTAHVPVISALTEGSILTTFDDLGNGVDTLFSISDSADGSSEIRIITEGGLYWYDFRDQSGSPPGEGGALQAPTTPDQWHVGFTVINEANDGSHYLDGALAAEGQEPFFADLVTPDTMAFGRNVDSGGPQWGFDGTLDEFRISSTLRSSNWVWAATQSIMDPDSLLTFGNVSNVDSPVVMNAEASEVTPLSALANGALNCEGAGATEVRVYWGTSDGGTNPLGWDDVADLGVSTQGPLSTPLGALLELTTYYYRFYGTNSAGEAWAPEATAFTTLSGLPIIDNADGATGQTIDSATLNGSLIDFGIPAQVTVYYGATDGGTTPGAWDTSVSLGITPAGALATPVSGLSEDTEYFYRHFASNVNGGNWAPGSESFRTSGDFSAWPRSQAITFPGYDRDDQVRNIPLLVKFSEALPTFLYADFAFTNGADLRFSDANGVLLSHEIEIWDPSGESVVWVKVPRLQGAATAITAYWGNAATGSTPPAYTTDGSVWSTTGYYGVWHFNETSGDVLDASGYGLHGIPSNGVTQGVATLAGQGITLDGDAGGAQQHVDLNAHLATIGALDEGSLMTLFRTPGTGVDTMFSMSDATDGSSEVRFIVEAGGLQYDVRDQDSGLPGEGGNLRAGFVSDDQWHVGTVVIDINDDGALYVDGELGATGAEPFLSDLQTPNTLGFGRNVDSGGPQWGFDGELDEFRISTALRSSNWNWAVAQNLVEHDAFTSYGLVDGAVLPAVTTEEPTSVAATSATLNGDLLSAGSTPTTVRVYFGTTDGGTDALSWDTMVDLGVLSAGPVSVPVSGLDDDAQYFYRYFSSNAGGDVWAPTGSEFVTPPLPLVAADFTKTLEICFDGYTPSEVLINFPALVVLNEGLTGFSYGDFASATGGDLRFTAGDGTTILAHEIESWNPAGDSHVWVQVPFLGSTTCIQAYWGNAGGTELPLYATNGSTWDETYHAVWHLNELANDGETNVAHHVDSSGNAKDATQVGNASTAGRIAGGQDMDGANDAIRSAERVLADGGSDFTVSLWVNSTDDNNGVLYWEAGVNQPGFWSRMEPTSSRIRGLVGPPNSIVATTNAFADGSWHLVTFVGKDANNFRIYVDGLLENEVTGAFLANTSDIGRIGERPGGADRLLGQVDEVRVAGTDRSANWVWATYVNQDPSADIATYGAVTDVGGGFTDTDGDGMPDYWEELHFGGATNGVAGADNDLDGLDNLGEWIADTIPTDETSFLKVNDVTTASPITVTFDSSTLRVYTLEYSEDLPAADWNPVPGQDRVPGSGAGDSLTDTNDAPAQRSYRLEVDLP